MHARLLCGGTSATKDVCVLAERLSSNHKALSGDVSLPWTPNNAVKINVYSFDFFWEIEYNILVRGGL